MTKIFAKEQEQQMLVSQRTKMYEYVGIADNHHRRKSDKRQIAPYHKRTKYDEKSVIKDHKA